MTKSRKRVKRTIINLTKKFKEFKDDTKKQLIELKETSSKCPSDVLKYKDITE